ncbi:MAG: hypothetical protein AB7O37_20220 [Vicinamibacteria bacterium]
MTVVDRRPVLRAIERYQVARMRSTHEALFRTPGYGPLCEFFVGDLYGPWEGGLSRAGSLAALADVLRPVLPAWIHHGAVGLIELHALSEQLDDRLARTLVAGGCSGAFSPGEFEAAYRRCDDYADRARQIALSEAGTSFGFELSRHRSVGRLLAAARRVRGPARAESLLALLERGHRAFGGVSEIGPFVTAMRAGELAYLDGIYSKARG